MAGNNLYGLVLNMPCNMVDLYGLILVAVDGTGSSSIKGDKKAKSHVYRFFEDSLDIEKIYLDGPGAESYEPTVEWDYNPDYNWYNWIWNGPADLSVSGAMAVVNTPNATLHYSEDKFKQATGYGVQEKHDTAVEFVCEKWNKNKKAPIDLVGHSRGGAVANELAKTLEQKGCCDLSKGCYEKPIRLRFLGLYDPINMTMNSWDRKISFNAAMIINVYASAPANGKRSRDSWNRVDQGVTWPPTTKGALMTVFFVPGTHSALGGEPWGGDHPAGHSIWSDAIASVLADIFVRTGYLAAGGKLK